LIRILLSIIWLLSTLGSPARSQPAAFPGIAPPERSRTINQRIVPQWTDDNRMLFSQQMPDGTETLRAADLTSGRITIVKTDRNSQNRGVLRGGPLPSSGPSDRVVFQEFINRSEQQVGLYWIDTSGKTKRYRSLKPGESHTQHTYAGHAWMVKADDGSFYGSLVVRSPTLVARIKRRFDPPEAWKRDEDAQHNGRQNTASNRSADRKFEYRRQGGRLQLRSTTETDGTWLEADLGDLDQREVVSPSWSPDGSVLAAWIVRRHPPADAVTIESSPPGGGRAKIRRRPYRLPGDPMDEYQLVAVDATTGKYLEHEMPVIDFGRPRIRWFGRHRLAIEKVDRGHQRVRLFVIDPLNGTTRVAIDETSATFLWTAHGPQVPMFTYLNDTDEVLYASEVSGYRHLYLVDLSADGDAKSWVDQPITSGQWLVRQIVRIDETARTLDLLVGQYAEGQDPYHRHLIRVAMDDQTIVAITESDGDHTVQFSPDGRFVIASFSRVDSPPIHELRRTSDGSLVAELMRAQRIAADDSAWSLPAVFHAAGRDGRTEIWGNLYFPADFDASLKAHYPVIEAIYAGPHNAHVPKNYLHSPRFEELTSLGFVVVQIDGMGTANRSKAFHDRCWQDLKDAGFPDRIAWIKSAAQQYPALDLSRVGIFGTSAGGQNACGALVFHGDFYRAAYASCGCHDNRMDKASWNEQWMGYPVADHYAESSNIEHADQLNGDLFLVVGELDSNVPPESTYRLVDALVKSDKDFRFLMIPGMGHGDGGRYGRKRMREFFVEKLKPAASPAQSPSRSID
jgi:dipeptidyl aminopeptidase/acylaminoacyl peptidase